MLRRRDHSKRLTTFARTMRRSQTDAEKKLWSMLRRDQLSGHHFRRQFPMAGYIIDFCCISAGLGVEADGGQHYDEKGLRYDQEREKKLLKKGIRIIRFSDYDILKHSDAVLNAIHRALTEPPPPQPSPGVPGEGE